MEAEASKLFRGSGPAEELMLTPELEAHLLERATYDKHNVTVLEILEVHELEPKYFINRGPDDAGSESKAPLVMVGPTSSGRVLAVPIDPTGEYGIWRPRTAFEANAHHKDKYEGVAE
jgi:hypothetical protein